MVRLPSGSPRGRYLRGDACPRCSVDEPRSSRLESDVFNLMQFVLGPAEQDVPVPDDRRMRLDMRFRGRGDLPIGVEYDGAYWHAGREDADLLKSARLMATGTAAVVVRIRESPLSTLTRDDVCTPAGGSAPQIAIAALLHLVHIQAIDADVEARIAAAIVASAVTIDRRRILCRVCRRIMFELLDFGTWDADAS
jgi:hypothetical protein